MKNHWKFWFIKFIERKNLKDANENSNYRMSLEYSEEEDDSEGYIQLRMDPNVNLGQE